ncbi:MAG: hypothetical protein WDM90_07495 [Ferruginibacter sp.]
MFAWGLIAKADIDGLKGWKLIIIAALCALATSQPAMAIINWIVTIFARPAVLPKMDFSKGIPDKYRSHGSDTNIA